MATRKKACNHLEGFTPDKKHGKECEECVKIGGEWVNLRTCETCGVTLCCDSSPNKHASSHFREVGHPVVTSAMPDENWAWCFEHEVMKKT